MDKFSQGISASKALRFIPIIGLIGLFLVACDSTGASVAGKNNSNLEINISAALRSDESQLLRPAVQVSSVILPTVEVQAVRDVQPEPEVQIVPEVQPEPEVQIVLEVQPEPEVQLEIELQPMPEELQIIEAVSYTHLTLPTNREV